MSSKKYQKLALSASICLLFSVVSSLNTAKVLRRRKADSTPDRDVISNPSCKSSDCPSKSVCFRGDCCNCQCDYSYPNVLVYKRQCRGNNDIEKISNMTCAFSIRPSNEPMEVLLTTEENTGKIKFSSTSVRVNCDTDVTVERWEYLNAHDQWDQGSGNVFEISHRTVGGSDQNKKDLTFLEWKSKLNQRYSGLLIKVWLNCQSRRVGCLMAKLNGTYTYNLTPPTTSATTNPTTTTPTPTTSTDITRSDTEASSTTSSQTRKDSEPTPTTNEEKTPSTTTDERNNADKQLLGTDKQAQGRKATRTIVGTVAGILAVVCLIVILIVVYKKRKSCFTSMNGKNYKQQDSVKAIKDNQYQESNYSEVGGKDLEFDNPVYSDLTPAENVSRRSKQDPLPIIPGTESSYQPLNDFTRTPVTSEPLPPPLPPVSYPMGSDYEGRPAIQPAIDYEKPETSGDIPQPESTDYDNPPLAINSDKSQTESTDYDNPPLAINNGKSQPESTDYDNPSLTINNGKSQPESTDYDNTSLAINNGKSQPESTDYDNPPQANNTATDIPDYLELVPESTTNI